MQIGILQTGRVNPALVGRHGEYPDMFAALLSRADPGLRFRTWAVVDGEVPDDPAACDAWLVTGSKHGVYDDEPWIAPLKAMLRGARAARRPIVGVCFGHQIVAEAFGGRAEKSERGWGCGVHQYGVKRRPAWMADAPDRIAWHAMHQDQVTAVPDDATLLAASPFCPNAMLAYGDPEMPYAISVQAHPEFGTDYARELVAMRTGAAIPPDVAATAMQSFGAPVHGDAFARWVLACLCSHKAGAA